MNKIPMDIAVRAVQIAYARGHTDSESLMCSSTPHIKPEMEAWNECFTEAIEWQKGLDDQKKEEFRNYLNMYFPNLYCLMEYGKDA